jgi:hypothetical protein
LIGQLSLNGNIPHGLPGTFLHTGVGDVIAWKFFSHTDIPGGADGDYLQTLAGNVVWAPPSFTPSVITPGAPDQVFVTDSLGTTSLWSDNLILPGDLSVTGTADIAGNTEIDGTLKVNLDLTADSDIIIPTGDLTVSSGLATLQDVSINGDLKLDNISGTAGQVLTKTSPTDQAWADPVIPTVQLIRFTGFFGAQDLNISAGPNPVVFDTVNLVYNIATSTTGAITGITQPSATTFQTGVTGAYDISVLGYIDPTSSGIGNSDITLSIKVGVTEFADSCICNSTSHNFSGTFSSIIIPTGSDVSVIVRRVTGTNPLNTFAAGGSIPGFASTISFTLVDTI